MKDDILIIEAGRAEAHYWRDLWRYRELFCILAWRDVAVRYKQTVIGVAWAVLRPFLTMVVFTVIFGKLAKLPSDGGAPYRSWSSPACCRGTCSPSFAQRGGGQPRRQRQPDLQGLLPAADHPGRDASVTALVDFLVSLAILAGLMVVVRIRARAGRLLLLPFFVAARAVAPASAPGLWITALNVKYRDFRYIIPFILQFGLYVSPVGFSSAIVPEHWRLALQPESDGRRHRRLPLVRPRRRKSALLCRGSLLEPRVGVVLCGRDLVLPPRRAQSSRT